MWAAVGQKSSIYPLLFASNYGPNLIWLWRVTNILAIIATFLFPVFYNIATRLWFRYRGVQDYEMAHADDDTIAENIPYSGVSRVLRFLLSYSLFFLILTISLAIV